MANLVPNAVVTPWYEVLGISERADQSQIEDAYRELTKTWDLKCLRYRDDIRFEWGGYSETELKWFNAAHTVLGDPIKRQEYDAELERKRRGI
jgi:DnaJ-class molecular chaperone